MEEESRAAETALLIIGMAVVVMLVTMVQRILSAMKATGVANDWIGSVDWIGTAVAVAALAAASLAIFYYAYTVIMREE